MLSSIEIAFVSQSLPVRFYGVGLKYLKAKIIIMDNPEMSITGVLN